MMKSQGITNDKIVEMSESLVGLAGDMASFYNLDIATAFEKIRSGISGETEPLKQLGINMNVTNMEAYALSQGIERHGALCRSPNRHSCGTLILCNRRPTRRATLCVHRTATPISSA